MDTIQVTVSGTVGKQIIPLGKNQTSATRGKVVMRGIALRSVSTPASVVVRDGNASGTIFTEIAVGTSGFAQHFCAGRGRHFGNGIHVKVLGTNAAAYVEID